MIIYFDSIVNQIYSSELQLNSFDTEAPFLGLHLNIRIVLFLLKFDDKRDDFDFVNFHFLDGYIPRATYYGVYLFLSSFGSLECLAMLLTLTLEIKF